MALFRSSGRLVQAHLDIFSPESWLQVMLGQGLHPQAHHPLAEQLTLDECAYFLRSIRTGIQRQVAAMPTHEGFIARHCAAQVPPKARH